MSEVKKEEFVMREIRFTCANYGEQVMKVTRFRSTTGAGISIHYAGRRITIEGSDDYEQRAYDLADLIRKACDDPCLIDDRVRKE